MPDTPLTDQQHAAIRQRIAAAFEREDAQNWGYDHGFCADPFGDPETGAFVDAALAVVQPELDRLRAERDQARAELTRRRTEDLTLRGILAPADGPRPVPMPLGDSLAPAVEWLLAELSQARAQTDAARDWAAELTSRGGVLAQIAGGLLIRISAARES